jgi:hypothetical protein
MAVKLGNDHTTYLYSLVEGLCLLEASLTDRGVHHENASVRVDGS